MVETVSAGREGITDRRAEEGQPINLFELLGTGTQHNSTARIQNKGREMTKAVQVSPGATLTTSTGREARYCDRPAFTWIAELGAANCSSGVGIFLHPDRI